MKIKILSFLIVCALIAGCATTKPHEQIALNQSNAQLNSKTIDKGITSFQSYREGSAGAMGGKSGGGCGCN